MWTKHRPAKISGLIPVNMASISGLRSLSIASLVVGAQSVLNASEDETIEFSTPKFGIKNYPASFAWNWFLIILQNTRFKSLSTPHLNWSKLQTARMTTWKSEKPMLMNHSPTPPILEENMGQFCPNLYVALITQVQYGAWVTWFGYISGVTVTPLLLTEDSKPPLKQVSK